MLCLLARRLILCVVLVQPMKRPDIGHYLFSLIKVRLSVHCDDPFCLVTRKPVFVLVHAKNKGLYMYHHGHPCISISVF